MLSAKNTDVTHRKVSGFEGNAEPFESRIGLAGGGMMVVHHSYWNNVCRQIVQTIAVLCTLANVTRAIVR